MLSCRGGKPTCRALSQWSWGLARVSIYAQIGTPMWWKELGAVLGYCQLAEICIQKIQASFYILEVQSRMSPEEGYSVPPTPQSLNRGAYFPDNLTYQDVRQRPTLLTVAYCWCLQHWAEKCNPPRNPDFCPSAEGMRELRQAIYEFINITWEDVIKGLEMEEPEGSHQLPPMTIFGHVLNPPGLIERRQRNPPPGTGL